MSKAPRSMELGATILLLLLVAGFHAWWATRAWNVPGLSGHEFRQAQTAVSIREMIKDGRLRMDYATPILGKPWSLPMEFPTYQFAVASLCRATGLGLVPAGRLVSLLCFYAGLPALYLLLRRAEFSRFASALALIPVLLAPVYIFYSRTVMIEALAWSASAWFLFGVVRYRAGRRPGQLAFALIVGIVAVLTKATTWAVFCAPWGGLMLWDLWRALRERDRRRAYRVADEVALLVVPLFAVGLGWVWIADRIKEMNPIATFLSSQNLREFNFGTWAQRMDPAIWRAIWAHAASAVMPGWAVGVTLAAVVLTTRRARALAGVALLGVLAGPLVFFNLYAIHDYYGYANAVFLCGIAGLAAGALWDRGGGGFAWRTLAVGGVALVGVGQWQSYRRDFYQVQMAYNVGHSSLTQAIHDLTEPDDVVVVHSRDWSAILSYQIDRRMVMIPDSQMFYRIEAVRQEIGLLRDEKVPLVVFWGESRGHADWAMERIRDFALDPIPLFTWGTEATVYAESSRYAELSRRLARGHYSQVVQSEPPLMAPIVPLLDAPAVIGAENLDPRPLAGSLPYGPSERWRDGRRYFFAHSPTELEFRIAPDATRVELGYVMDPQVYEHKEFDGVYVRAEVRAGGQLVRVIYQEMLDPAGPRTPRHVSVPLTRGEGDTLIFRVMPGPAGNNAYDWALLEYLRIR